MKIKIPNISKLNKVTLLGNGVLFRRAYGTGEGMLVNSSDCKDISVLCRFKVFVIYLNCTEYQGFITTSLNLSYFCQTLFSSTSFIKADSLLGKDKL